MSNKYYHFLLVISIFSLNACKKEQVTIGDCLNSGTTTRQITNQRATIKQPFAELFYIVEQGSIDTKLKPCNLPAEYQVNNLQVTISGVVKAIAENNPVPPPCCLEDFVITAISR